MNTLFVLYTTGEQSKIIDYAKSLFGEFYNEVVKTTSMENRYSYALTEVHLAGATDHNVGYNFQGL